MFIEPKLSKIQTSIFTSNYSQIKSDYIEFRDCNYYLMKLNCMYENNL